jgi:hypothetical protein
MRKMKAYIIFAASGVMIILTSYNSISNPKLLRKLAAKGIDKFIAYNVVLEMAQQRYGKHFDIVCQDLHESDDLRILDYNGERAFRNFSFSEFGEPVYYESEKA